MANTLQAWREAAQRAGQHGAVAALGLNKLTREGCFCVRFVFSQGELTIKGGWAGVYL